MASRKKQNTFRLKNIRSEEIDKQYGFDSSNVIYITDNVIPPQTTKITELKNNIILMDELKSSYNARVSMIHTSKDKRYNCFWDRHPIVSGTEIYCPIERINDPKIKTYTSHINGKQYKIQDSIQLYKDKEVYKNYYIDGIFCSTECCLAFIEDNKHNPLYQYSEFLLRDLYNLDSTRVAPHWRLLIEYGGNQTIEEFRKSFINITYSMDGVSFHPMSFIFKETYHL